jgi:16S rRNA (cytosine967-C5)-methyltransferase
MSVASSQQQVFLRLLRALRSRWHSDQALPRQIQLLLSGNRTFGSRDRRLYRELLYTTLRYLPWIEPWLDRDPERAVKITAWLSAETRDTRAYRVGTCADWPGLPSLAARAEFLQSSATDLLPAWFKEHCPAVFEPRELESQLNRAPLWLRLQTPNPAEVSREFNALDWRSQPSPALSSAWRMLGEVDVTKTDAYSQGRIEVQDLGSQLVLESIAIGQGERWLDACAGAGGKTLQLSQRVGPAGTVEAHDIRPAALDEMLERAERAGVENIRITAQPADASYAGVLVDAPCSGSGTWRRAPHLKWTTTPEIVASRAQLQRTLLDRFAACVQPGGLLVYATCSLSEQENAAVVRDFLASRREFSAEAPTRTFGFKPAETGLTILPARHDTDGFFVAPLRRR